jgi:nucleoside-diphosphate-sugar epimerase
MKTFVVTGGRGRLGSFLLPLLSHHGKVLTLSRSEISGPQLKKIIVDKDEEFYLVHLAWPVRTHDYLYNEGNREMLKMSKSIMLTAGDLGFRIISVGSVLEAGEKSFISDKIMPNPQNLYAECKAKLQQFLVDVLPNTHIWARTGYQVSSFDPPHKLLPYLLTNQNRPVKLSGAKNLLDFIHVQDVATAFERIISRYQEFPREIVIGAGRVIEVESLAKSFGCVYDSDNSLHSVLRLQTIPNALFKSGWNAKFLTVQELHDAAINELVIRNFKNI